MHAGERLGGQLGAVAEGRHAVIYLAEVGSTPFGPSFTHPKMSVHRLPLRPLPPSHIWVNSRNADG